MPSPKPHLNSIHALVRNSTSNPKTKLIFKGPQEEQGSSQHNICWKNGLHKVRNAKTHTHAHTPNAHAKLEYT